MPKKSDPGDGEKQGSIEFMYFKLNGGNSTLQEAIRTINSMVNRAVAGSAALPPKRVNALPARGEGNGATTDSESLVEDIDVEAAPNAESEATSTVPENGSSSSKKRSGPVKYPEPTLLDIDFNAADVSLKDFVKPKDPKSHNDKFLIVGAWFRQHGNVEEITSDHVYSAYQAMSWKSRKNMDQPFYFLKEKGWATKTDKGWRLTHIGLDEARSPSKTATE